MSTAQEISFEQYHKLLIAPPGKWLNTAGEVCYTFMDNGLSICLYLDETNKKCISLYKLDENGAVKNTIILQETKSPELFQKFFVFYNQLKAKVDDERFSLLVA